MSEIGKIYGRLTIIEVAAPSARGFPRFVVKCSCALATVKIVARADLRSGHTQSCGCIRVETTKARATTHGKTETAEYRIWSHMIGRCYNETDHKYKDYGGRGIRVCERWRESFTAFLVDMGPRPSPDHSINRLDNDGQYEPDNCAWATPLEQGQNKRNNVYVVLRGESVVVAEAERRLGLVNGLIVQRVKQHEVSHQEATDWYASRTLIDKRPRNMVNLWGEMITASEAERRLGVSTGAIHNRAVYHNISEQEATDWFVAKYGGQIEQLRSAVAQGSA